MSGPARIFTAELAAAELKAAKARCVQFVALGEPDYAPGLPMIDDPPPLIAVRGQRSWLPRRASRLRSMLYSYS
ncbi:MAG: hypothetical protein P8Y71_03275 [Pseudolabrys sp.]